jgi:hypothetical protein
MNNMVDSGLSRSIAIKKIARNQQQLVVLPLGQIKDLIESFQQLFAMTLSHLTQKCKGGI